MDSRSLRQRIPHGLAAYIVHEVAKGLDYAHKRRDGRGESMDIVQEAYQVAWQKIEDFEMRGPGSILHWLSKIAENKIKDGAVTSSKIKSSSVTSGKIKNGSVSFNKLAEDVAVELDDLPADPLLYKRQKRLSPAGRGLRGLRSPMARI